MTEVIVTANKRQENIQNVGMSIQAASGDALTKLGVTDTASLAKIVPGFVVTPNYYGTNVFTIRGVGFQDTSLAGSPTVTVYQDEAPLPFSVLTNGATLDLQRVEVLKGPQGTLFGNNATGGAINYIANKPTDHFESGMDVTVGKFGTANVEGFLSGPLTSTLDGRIALQSNNSGAWQKGYGPMNGQTTGGTDFLNGRISLQWKPNDQFKALLTLNGWRDKSFNQVGQYAGPAADRNQPIDPLEANFPLPPHNDQAAAWQNCVNTSSFDPLTSQNSGTLYYTPYYPDGTKVTSGPTTGIVPAGEHPLNSESMGAGSVAQTGGIPTSCVPMRRNNNYFSATLRMDYDLGSDMTVTSLTEFQRFNRDAAIDGAGVPYNTYQSVQYGKITSVYQELRLSGKWWDNKGNWIVGANYEYDSTFDRFLQTYNGSQSSPAALPASALCGVYTAGAANACTLAESPFISAAAATALTPDNPAWNSSLYPLEGVYSLGPTAPVNKETTDTYAIYASGEYPLLENLSLVGGVRFTQENKSAQICGEDGGDGTWAAFATRISNLNQAVTPGSYLANNYAALGYVSPIDAYLNGAGGAVNPGAYGCAILGPAPNYQPLGANLPTAHLNENNISWRAGLNWKVQPQTLLYVTISQGYKGGAFPTIAETTYAQNVPAKQEGLLSYEVGFKGTWLEHQLQLNGAFFYYDYNDKQILGAVDDPVFGALAELVNVPKSHVIGFELSAIVAPQFLPGLTITPSLSYQNSKIDGCSPVAGVTTGPGCHADGNYYATTPFPQVGAVNVTGEHFPDAPLWQATIDAEYDWTLRDDLDAFVGLNAAYNSSTYTSFTDPNPSPGLVNNDLPIPGYTLLDLRAGIQKGNWRGMVWAHNVTNTYYWTSFDRVNDTLLKYTGMPATYGVTISYRFR